MLVRVDIVVKRVFIQISRVNTHIKALQMTAWILSEGFRALFLTLNMCMHSESQFFEVAITLDCRLCFMCKQI